MSNKNETNEEEDSVEEMDLDQFILWDQIELHGATLKEAVEVLKEMSPNMTEEQVSDMVYKYKYRKRVSEEAPPLNKEEAFELLKKQYKEMKNA